MTVFGVPLAYIVVLGCLFVCIWLNVINSTLEQIHKQQMEKLSEIHEQLKTIANESRYQSLRIP